MFSGQEVGKARLLESEESPRNPSTSFWARRKWRRRNICKKSRKGVIEECENSREIVKRKGVDVFLGRSGGKISLAWICDVRDTHHTLCMLLGWQRICSRFYQTKRLRENYLWEEWVKGISVVWNMGNSYGLKRKGVDLSQGPPKRKRDVVQIPAVIETPSVPTENAPSSSGWHSNVVLLLDHIMSFLAQFFSWAFPSYIEVWFFFAFLFCLCVDNFPWPIRPW